jgi:hypothetical protein
MRKFLFLLINLFLNPWLLQADVIREQNQIPQEYALALKSCNNGFGYDVYNEKEKNYEVEAQALIVSAEANRYRITGDQQALRNRIIIL